MQKNFAIPSTFLIGLVALANVGVSQTLAQNEITGFAHHKTSPSPSGHQVAKAKPVSSIELDIGGTIFRVPCNYFPFVLDANGKRIVCWKIPGQRIAASMLSIPTGDENVHKADKTTKFPWMKSLNGTQISVNIIRPNNKQFYPYKYLEFIRNKKNTHLK